MTLRIHIEKGVKDFITIERKLKGLTRKVFKNPINIFDVIYERTQREIIWIFWWRFFLSSAWLLNDEESQLLFVDGKVKIEIKNIPKKSLSCGEKS